MKQSKTRKNLINSYAGECQAHVRYRMMKETADKAQLYEIGCAIDELARNEQYHAKRFYAEIMKACPEGCPDLRVDAGYPFREKGELLPDLSAAADNEYNESLRIYPAYAKDARDEGFDGIAALFELVAAVEHCHMMQLNNIKQQLSDGTVYKRGTPVKWKCSRCGHEQESCEAPAVCPLCGSVRGYVKPELPDN